MITPAKLISKFELMTAFMTAVQSLGKAKKISWKKLTDEDLDRVAVCCDRLDQRLLKTLNDIRYVREHIIEVVEDRYEKSNSE